MRLDNELVSRNLISTRSKAKASILEGIVYCDNVKIKKPSFEVTEETIIEIRGNVMPFVSRGGLKLLEAIKSFNIDLNGKFMIDIGSSTGGFTDCALQNGIDKVVAIDVGKDQMVDIIKNNPKVSLYEKTDFRNIDLDIIKGADIATIDVSFISTKLIMPKLNDANVSEIVCLIKPQFECGKEVADKYKGIILNKNEHIKVLNNVIGNFKEIKYHCHGLIKSPIRGGDGNVEYLGYFRREKNKVNIDDVVNKVFK